MARGKIGGFLAHLIVSAVLFLSLINIVFSFHAWMLKGEFLLLLFLLFFAFVSLAGKLIDEEGNWPNGGLLLVYSLVLVNFLFIYWIDGGLAVGTIGVAIIGFLLALFSFKKGCQCCETDDFKETKVEEPKAEVTTSFEPGKYVASKTGKKFHAPKCDWAKKIHKKRQVWFNTKEEAESKGLKACDCIV